LQSLFFVHLSPLFSPPLPSGKGGEKRSFPSPSLILPLPKGKGEEKEGSYPPPHLPLPKGKGEETIVCVSSPFRGGGGVRWGRYLKV